MHLETFAVSVYDSTELVISIKSDSLFSNRFLEECGVPMRMCNKVRAEQLVLGTIYFSKKMRFTIL